MQFFKTLTLLGTISIPFFCLYEWFEHALPKRQSYTIANQPVPLRILVISDLHGSPFLLHNKCFWKRIQEEKVDMICIAGDLINKYGEEKNFTVLPFLKMLSEIAPVYYSYGNHESKWCMINPEQFASYRKQVLNMGIHFLDNETALFEKENKTIQIIGFTMPQSIYKKGKKPNITADLFTPVYKLAKHSTDYTILLAHSPEDVKYYKKFPVNLICSGHLHGGIIRLPIIGGIVSPQLRLTRYTKGVYKLGNVLLLVSAGLGSHTIWVRLWNRVEYIICDLTESNKSHTGGA